MSAEMEIKATFEDYATAYCAKDINALLHVFDSSNAISVIGTGNEELCVGQRSVKDLFLKNFSEATATQFEWGWSDMIIFHDHAVVAQSLVIHLNIEGDCIQLPVRWSVFLHKADRWVWVHRHASTAAISQGINKAYPSPTTKPC